MLFLPRALQVRGLKSASTDMAATPDVVPLILAYLRKRKLTKPVKALLAETKFKETGSPVDEDLESIYASHVSTKLGCLGELTESRNSGSHANVCYVRKSACCGVCRCLPGPGARNPSFATTKGKVSTLSKGRCIHGLPWPWSLPVASWMLILLLLLTSSYCDVHQTQERGDAVISAEDDYLEPSKGEKMILGRRGGSIADGPSMQFTGNSNNGRLETRSGSSLFQETGETGDIANRVEHAQRIHLSSGSPLDALQYAEYGAELLHKSGAAEKGSETCVVDNTGSLNCPLLMDHDGSPAMDCLKSLGNLQCKNECFCEQQGLTLYRSLEREVDTKTCLHDRSLRDVFFYTCDLGKETKEQQGIVDGEGSYEVDQTSTVPFGQASVVEISDPLGLTPPSDDNAKLHELNDARTGEEEILVLDQRINLESSNIVTGGGGTASISHEDLVEPLPDPNVCEDMENDSGKNSVLLSMEPYPEASGDGKVREGSRVSTYPPVDLLQIDSDDLFMEELQSMIKTDEEGLTGGVETENQLEPAKLRRMGQVMSLDEYKRSILEKQQLSKAVDFSTLQTPKIRHSDETYNYAASSHGAKVLSANKEAKGAGHIIKSDKDKYLRNPCSAEDKFVVLELSEETFVDTIVIANFEFHSANLKDFEVYGSPVYPTKEWILLGQFHAENVRHRQKFTVEDPKLVRYVMLKMLSHWGSEFFCTLSAVEVFGVDVLKNLLDDWIASEEGEHAGRAQVTGSLACQEEIASDVLHGSAASSDGTLPESPSVPFSADAFISPDSAGTLNRDKNAKDEESKTSELGPELHHIPGGKPPGDSVLKILMQKVKALELNQSLFDNYLEDTNTKYKAMLSELDKDLALMSEKLRNATAMSTLLAIRVLEMESKLKEEKSYLEYQLSMIASNFTENMEFMRWQIQSMERREIIAITFAFLSPILAAFLHLLARCMPNRRSLALQELGTETEAETTNWQLDACSLHSVCKMSSSAVLYLACGLTVLVLSV